MFEEIIKLTKTPGNGGGSNTGLGIFQTSGDLPTGTKGQYAVVLQPNPTYWYYTTLWTDTNIPFYKDSANGKTFNTLTDLTTAYPTGNIGDACVVGTVLYTWSGTAWVSTDFQIVNDNTTWMRRLIKFLSPLTIKASGGQLRTVVDNVVGGTMVVTQATAANLNVTATLLTLPDITALGGISAKQLQFTNSRINYAVNSRSRLSYT